ncbi:MAG: metal ABC transporter permease [Candidatus Cloacimonadota bacterium]|nr:MAG: metal ABC transporter permease [Candidatus Cloacimonadota bacterium]
MFELLTYKFMQNAFLSAMLVSIACGIIGTYVVTNRIVFISGGIAHSAYGGIGLGYFLGINPVIGAIIFSIISAVSMGLVSIKTEQKADTIIGVMWAVGMAIGIIFIDLTPGYTGDLMSYLFGSILTVSYSDIFIMIILDIIILSIVMLFFKEFLILSFDKEFAQIRGLNVNLLYIILLILIAGTVVMLMKIVGLIMLIALLTIPAAISSKYTSNLAKMMILSSILGMIFTTLGLIISYYSNLTSGPCIILVAAIGFFLSFFKKPIRSV